LNAVYKDSPAASFRGTNEASVVTCSVGTRSHQDPHANYREDPHPAVSHAHVHGVSTVMHPNQDGGVGAHHGPDANLQGESRDTHDTVPHAHSREDNHSIVSQTPQSVAHAHRDPDEKLHRKASDADDTVLLSQYSVSEDD
jgi:hypothetical protein